jgi:ribosomal protein S18 acetylase RimI-like enzyme
MNQEAGFLIILAQLSFIGIPLMIAVLLRRAQGTRAERYDGSGRRVPNEQIRDLIPDLHLPDVVRVDSQSFDPNWRWSHEDFCDNLGIVRILVYETSPRQILGYIAYFASPGSRFEILRLAVQPMSRRCGIATELIRRVAQDAVHFRVDAVTCDVSEDMLAAQVALKRVGFLFERKLDADDRVDPDRDLYRFKLSTATWCCD